MQPVARLLLAGITGLQALITGGTRRMLRIFIHLSSWFLQVRLELYLDTTEKSLAGQT